MTAPPDAGPRLRVTEIFHSIQGESSLAGWPCVFIRLTGCPLRCVYCDTAYAFDGGEAMTVGHILERVRSYGCPLVEVTGGEPLSQPSTLLLLRLLADEGYRVLLETAGCESIETVDRRVKIIYDIKTPGSGEGASNRWQNLQFLKPADEVKLVITSREDYLWARDFLREKGLAERHLVHLSPCFGALESLDLARWILEDRLPVRLNLQLHKVLFGPHTRAV